MFPPEATPKAIIDTQVVMDWLVFNDGSVGDLAAALEEGRLQWLGSPDMLDELRHVLGRGVAAHYAPDLPRIEATFARLCHTMPDSPSPAVRLKCRDEDDQKFIDLAIASSADWLISRDKAVLALAKRARAFGLSIVTPAGWLRQQMPAPDSVD